MNVSPGGLALSLGALGQANERTSSTRGLPNRYTTSCGSEDLLPAAHGGPASVSAHPTFALHLYRATEPELKGTWPRSSPCVTTRRRMDFRIGSEICRCPSLLCLAPVARCCQRRPVTEVSGVGWRGEVATNATRSNSRPKETSVETAPIDCSAKRTLNTPGRSFPEGRRQWAGSETSEGGPCGEPRSGSRRKAPGWCFHSSSKIYPVESAAFRDPTLRSETPPKRYSRGRLRETPPKTSNRGIPERISRRRTRRGAVRGKLPEEAPRKVTP